MGADEDGSGTMPGAASGAGPGEPAARGEGPPEQGASPEGRARPTRRVVLTVLGVGAAGAAAGVGTAWVASEVSARKRPARWRALTDAEALTLDHVCEQIIPADQDPGARDAGVVNFIDRQLVGPYRRHLEAYRSGLAALQATSRERFGAPFEQLRFEQQTELLKALDEGKAPKAHWKPGQGKAFFELVRAHTMQGFYGSPRHGGNKDYVSYRMLGIQYPRVIGRNRY